jgi:formylglycine-generating enzyme required for sulfatase activity
MRYGFFYRVFAGLGLASALLIGCEGTDDGVGVDGFVCGEGTAVVNGQCIANDASLCGEGTRLEAGACVANDDAACGTGTRELDGRCVPDDDVCGEGTRLDGEQCVVTGSGVVCGEGTLESEGICVPSTAAVECGEGTSYDDALQACIADPVDTVVCGPGTELVDGSCAVAFPTVCGAGTERVGDTCVASDSDIICGAGTELVDGQCRAASGAVECGEGTEEIAGFCTPVAGLVCGAGTERIDDACVPTDTGIVCGTGTELVDGACVPTLGGVTCGAGTVEEEGECRAEVALSCGAGTERIADACFPTGEDIICGARTELVDGACVPTSDLVTCGEGTRRDEFTGTCVVDSPIECGPGTTLVDGDCLPSDEPIVCGEGTIEITGRCELLVPALRCGTGTVLSGDTCVIASATECGVGTSLVDGRCYPDRFPIPEDGDQLVWFTSDGSLGQQLNAGVTLEYFERGVVESVDVVLIKADTGDRINVTPWVDVSFTGAGGIAWTREGFSVAGEGASTLRASLGALSTSVLSVRGTLTGTGTPTLLPSTASLQLEFELDLKPITLVARYANGVERDVTDEVTWSGDTSRASVRRIRDELYVLGVAGGETVFEFSWTPPASAAITARVAVTATPLLESPALVSPLTGALVVDPLSSARLYIPPGAVLTETLIEITEIGDGIVEFGPSGLQFVNPARAEVRLATAQEPGSPWDLELFNETTLEFEPLGPAAEVGTDGFTIRFDVNHFSRYQPSAPDAARYQDLCETYAPALHFEPNDSRPMSIESYFARSRLVTRTPGLLPFTTNETVDDTPTSAEVLASASIANAERVLALDGAYRSACAKLSISSGWAAACREWMGDTVDPTIYCRPVTFTAPDTIVDGSPRMLALQYWMLYDASGLPGGAAPFGRVFHEADWEFVQVILDEQNEPLVASTGQHWYGETRFGTEIPLVDGRPHISVARYSHASLFGDNASVGTWRGNIGFFWRYSPSAIRAPDVGGEARVADTALNVVLATGNVLKLLQWDGVWGDNVLFGAAGVGSPARRQPSQSAGPDPWTNPLTFALTYYHPTEASLATAREALGVSLSSTVERWFVGGDIATLASGGSRLARLSLLAGRCRPDENALTGLWSLLSAAQTADLYRGRVSAESVLAALPGDWCDGGEPAAPECLDSCGFAGQRRCAADGVQYCRRTTDGCLNWSDISACAFGDACESGYCRPTSASAGAVCQPGALRCDSDQNLALTCSSDGSRWSGRPCGSLTCTGGVCFDLASGCGAGQTPTTWYEDADSDGFGWFNRRVLACEQPPGYARNNADCDDNRETAYPGAGELCDGRDTDCDGLVDNACTGGEAAPPGFVLVPPGTFLMGAPAGESGADTNERPQHTVTITQAFWMKSTEVTQGEWFDVVGNRPSNFPGCGDECPVERVNWWEALAYANLLSDDHGFSRCYSLNTCTGTLGSTYSCSGVSWNQSCTGYRLPTEAEWEFAYRAGTNTAYYSGPGDTLGVNVDRIAWYSANSGSTTQPVGLKEPNALELYDMAGNVYEWCWDWYSATYYSSSPANDPSGPGTGSYRVYRGGSWSGAARSARAANRSNNTPGARSDYLGFRLARSAP